MDYAWPGDYWPDAYWAEYWPDYGTGGPVAVIPVIYHHLTQQGVS